MYEHWHPTHLLQQIIPSYHHMRLINGYVECKDENNCDFIAYAFDIHSNPNTCSSSSIPTTSQPSKLRAWIRNNHDKCYSTIPKIPKTIQTSKRRPWIHDQYFDKKTRNYVKLDKPNKYSWAGPTKKLSFEEIYDIGEEWCKKHSKFYLVYNNCHDFAYDLYQKIKQ
ncbi:uncharacterized protein PgNI_01517 [Pyricularia grisea]|uniref:Uncharacterized protein n=1 Tax=Pyricularia grisea TaxID=148305 RepID=A0A6P8BI39_PYRGI